MKMSTEPKIVSMGCAEMKEGVFKSWSLEYPFIKTCGGKSEAEDKKYRTGCTIRALAVGCEISYDQAAAILKEEAMLNKKGGSYFYLLADGMEYRDEAVNGYKFKWRAFPAVKGQTRMNPAKFCAEFKQGRFIARTAKHVFAVIDGVVHDSWEQRPDRCIYGVWELTKQVS